MFLNLKHIWPQEYLSIYCGPEPPKFYNTLLFASIIMTFEFLLVNYLICGGQDEG